MTLMERHRALMAQGGASIIDGAKLTWTQGLTNLYYGTLKASDYYISSDFIDISDKECSYIGALANTDSVNYSCYILQYDQNGNFMSYLPQCKNGVTCTAKLSAFCKKVKITIGHSSSGVTIDPSEGALVKIKAVSIPTPTVTWLYNNGTISDILVAFLASVGYRYNQTYNTISVGASGITYSNTSTSTASTIKGGNSVTSQNELPASVIGKRVYFRGTHKNTSSSQTDYATLVISDAVTPGTNFNAAFGSNYIYRDVTLKTDSSATLFGSSLTLSRAGYLSLVGRKSGGGAPTIIFKEVWME